MTPKILVPIDFAESTDHVVRKAAELACELDAGVVLMHSVQPPNGLDGGTDHGEHRPTISLLADDARGQLADYAGELMTQGIEVKQVVTIGAPMEQIVRMAEEERVVRIVMGTKERQGLSRILSRSIADQVARKAASPVVLVESKPLRAAKSHNRCSSGPTETRRRLGAEQEG